MSKHAVTVAGFAACSLFYLTGCSGPGSTATEVIVVAAAGETAPGLDDGYVYERIDPTYTIGASGEVAFSATANISNGSARDRKHSVWFGMPDELVIAATVGQPVPELDSDILISGFETTPGVITESSRLGFIVRTSTSSPGMSPQALLVYADEELEKVIAAGDPVPMPSGAVPLLSISQFAMSDAGILFMGKVARNQSGLWFWDYADLRLVAVDRTQVNIGTNQCDVRSVASTTLDVNRDGVAVFRLSLGGNECARGGIVAWDPDADTLLPIALNGTAIAADTELYYQSVTGDARVSDMRQVALHANVYDNSASTSGAREMTLLQVQAGGPSYALLNKNTPLELAPDITLTHTIVGDGLAVISDKELVHFVRSNRDRIILRTLVDDEEISHAVIARTGLTVGDQVAARIGDGHVNRNGDVVFTSFIDDGAKGGTYQQELWFAAGGGDPVRLAFPGQSLAERSEETIERIDISNQSHEPKMHNTQGGRSRLMDDSGATLFAGRLRKASQWYHALFIASPE